jgi:hypothetical protein
MPGKIIDTLNLNILKSIYTIISLIMFCKLYFIAIPKYFKPLLLENYIRFVALMLDSIRVSFYNLIEFFHYSSPI